MEGDKPTGYSLLLRNLRYSTTTQLVREAFERFGKIRDVYLPLDFNTKRPRGFGFVEFSHEADAMEAVKAMDNAKLDGNVITCCMAQDRRKSPNSMRRAYNNATPGRRYDFSPPNARNGQRQDYYPGMRSRSRSPAARYSRRSPSYDRRYPPMRDDYPYYYRRDHDRSPQRYPRHYPPHSREYRDHRPEYMERDARRYTVRPPHIDYARPVHERRRSPPRGPEPEELSPDSHDMQARRPPRKI
ncbi:RNA recognition motif containing protein, putative [Babesia bigemina]|uniref:RNA recognition motif containing protein, putative n=1 Tax=Babesia bigemina TaxID=5866 RepID=A0A061D2L9_BABBI|nr:RNA recognition motif containing protein, putative [Babesia bigemina]CDR95026.1 RNA recognition motif containing protein, putative [Babesia bigemina]|eukprot:XP_012767212.1 RNA recognition motif containing protein, putative [Babesia bigemina]